jgi:hypothetical protein
MVRGSWDTTSLGKRVHLDDIWGLNNDRVYCCGMHGVLLTRVAGSWNRADGLQGDLIKVRGLAEDDLYVLGERGAIFHFDGSRWAAIDSPTKKKLVHLLCVSKDIVYACGRSGAIFRMTRNRWEQVSGCESSLYSLAHFRDRIFVGAGNEGILEVRGAEVISFRKDVVAYGLEVIGDRLLAFGKTQISQFDGQRWSQESLNFGSLIGE